MAITVNDADPMTIMKTSTAIVLALTLAACGQPSDTRAQDGVFAENRVVPGDALAIEA